MLNDALTRQEEADQEVMDAKYWQRKQARKQTQQNVKRQEQEKLIQKQQEAQALKDRMREAHRAMGVQHAQQLRHKQEHVLLSHQQNLSVPSTSSKVSNSLLFSPSSSMDAHAVLDAGGHCRGYQGSNIQGTNVYSYLLVVVG